MWNRGWRDTVWSNLGETWDVVIVGGGITGAGILAEATRLGMRALLVEARDFASGTSSRSTKLVHGGLRYLRNGQVRLTRESVREREHLMREAPGLVTPLGFFLTSFEGDKMPKWMFGAGLAIYDVLASKWAHKSMSREEIIEACKPCKGASMRGGYHYYDAQTDDSRLTLRVLREACARGGVAINYARVETPLRDGAGKVHGVALRDVATGRTAEVKARAVVNATGVWADDLREKIGETRKLRAIRGSHLVFSHDRVPIPEALSLLHPRDERAVFAVPWEGVTLIGTTDVDHGRDLETEPSMSQDEATYIMEAAARAFPTLDLTLGDVRSSYAGVRSVIDTGARDPSKESREHALWLEHGMLTVTGGKLTTFRLMARDALEALGDLLPRRPDADRILDDVDATLEGVDGLAEAARARLVGRHGAEAAKVLAAGPDALTPIGDGIATWGELRWAARAEGVVHLEDLLLRRVRLGLLLGEGTLAVMARIRAVAQPELGWDDATWAREEAAYRTTWSKAYAPPR